MMAALVCATAIIEAKVVYMTASVFGPGVDRHSSRFDRIAYRKPGVRGDSRLHHVPAMSVACNKFKLGVWLYVQEWDKKLHRPKGPKFKVFNGDVCGTPSRIDFLLPVWDAMTGRRRPVGLIKCVKVWAA